MMILRTNRGYTLLFAVVVATIVLAIAAFILSISRKQFILASAARDSTLAIYAADSGIQCALKTYNNSGYHNQGDSFTATCNNYTVTGSFTDDTAGTDVPNVNYNTQSPAQVLRAQLGPLPIGNGCANITVYEGYEKSTAAGHITVIDSNGYNLGNSGQCPVPGPRDEERVIELVTHD